MDSDISDSSSDSDIAETPVNIPRVPDSPREGASLSAYQLALKDTQLALGEATKEIRRLALENATLRVELRDRSRGRKKKPAISGIELEIRTSGRGFGVMMELWVDASAFGQPRPALLPNSKDRYSSELSAKLGVIAEIYEWVPEKLHKLLLQDGAIFRQQFCKGSNDTRSSLLNKIRAHAPLIFQLEVPPTMYPLRTNIDRATVSAFQKMLKFDTSQSTYPTMAPILYPDGRMDAKQVFRNPILPRLLSFVLYGKDAVGGSKLNPKNKTNGRIWDVSKTTPGAIAWSAIVARYIISPDTEFNSKGTISKIDYRHDFESYKKILITKAESKTVKDLLNWWDSNVFPDSSNHGTTTASPTSGDRINLTDIERAMQGLDMETDDENDIAILQTINDPVTTEAHRPGPSNVNDSAVVPVEQSKRAKAKGKGKATDVPTRRAARTTRSRIAKSTEVELEEDEDGL